MAVSSAKVASVVAGPIKCLSLELAAEASVSRMHCGMEGSKGGGGIKEQGP
jgi:hypothetical protein